MHAIEFQTTVKNGTIEIPKEYLHNARACQSHPINGTRHASGKYYQAIVAVANQGQQFYTTDQRGNLWEKVIS
jgi:hypothetical protein